MTEPRPLVSGSLESFRADEVLQWLAHRRGETMVVFRPAGRAFGGGVIVHVRDGEAQALKILDGGVSANPPGRPRAGAFPRTGSGARRSRAPADPGALEPRAGSLGSLLLERGLVDPGQLRAGLGLQQLIAGQGPPRRIGEVVCDLGYADPAEVDAALRDHALQKLAALFQVRTGEFAVLPGCPDPPLIAIGQRVDHLLLRVAHLIDQAHPVQARG